MSSVIVVGVDGSEGSKRALAWAASEARVRSARIRLVRAWCIPASTGWTAARPEVIEAIEASATQELDEACEELAIDLVGLEVERCVVWAGASQALIDAAVDADLLVISSPDHDGLIRSLLGSVTQRCVSRSPCPLVIVRSQALS